MNSRSIVEKFDRLGIWSRGDERAPHKPLLVLYALGKWQRGNREPVHFSQLEPELTTLLREFGPSRQSYHPEYPFWRLQNDEVWVVEADKPMKTRASNNDVLKSELIAHDAVGGFTEEVRLALDDDPKLVCIIAGHLLDQHFPESIHNDILESVGLDISTMCKQPRNPAFRRRILTAYEYRCAVCSFDVRLATISIALDAAHIRWHQAGGPDDESNGVALCVIHHKLFDLGAFTISVDGRILVSDQVHGGAGFDSVLMQHHTKSIRSPQRPEWKLESIHLEWHLREVFKGEPRHHESTS